MLSAIVLFAGAAALGAASYLALTARRRGDVHVRNVQALQIGNRNRQYLHVDVPAALWAALVTLVAAALVVGAGWLYLGWFSPNFAPNYRTQFLVDTADTGGGGDLSAVTSALQKAVGNSGDHDALSLRRFGGECGAPANTASLAGFGTGDRRPLLDAAAQLRAGGRPTLVRGIVEAVEDFSKPLSSKARQVDRIIVVTRHGADACDDDVTAVQREIADRIGAAGLTLEFRVVGYQVPDDQHGSLDRLATAVKAPPTVYASDAAGLDRTVDWFSNVEPVLTSARAVVDTLNATVTQVNTAVDATVNGRLDVADRTLGEASGAVDAAGGPFADLADRVKTADTREVRDRAAGLRERQKQVVAAASALLRTARDGRPLDAQLQDFRKVATDYNDEVNAMNQVLAALRAKLTAGP